MKNHYILRPFVYLCQLLFLFSCALLQADPLIDAVHHRDLPQVKALLTNRPDLNARDEAGNTALHWAALNGDVELVKILLNVGSPYDVENKAGATPLIYAVAQLTIW